MEQQGKYAAVNGINLYYEIFGTGKPLILLHGGLGAIEMFGELLPQLAAGRQVIGVDLQAHGRTADIDRPLSLELMADDIAALIAYLGFPQVDIMGYSMGAGVALQTTIRYPALVHRLVAVSIPFKRQAWYPEVLASMAQMGPAAAEPMKQSPIYQLYASIAPRPEDWPVLLTKMGEMLRTEYDWTEDISSIQAPTLIVFGDADSVLVDRPVEFFKLLGGGKGDAGWDGSNMPASQLAILPGTSHYNSFSSPLLPLIAIPFLDQKD